MIDFTNEDCMELMSRAKDKQWDLAIVDPPYGLGEGQDAVNGRSRATAKWSGARPPRYNGGNWDAVIPAPEYFAELFRVSNNQIIWGANHFGNQRPSSGWIVWYK